MEAQQAIRTGIAASVIAHLSVLMLVLLFSDVHPFGSVTAEPMAVDVVTAEEVAAKAPEPLLPPEAKPSDAFDLAAKSAAPNSPAPEPASTPPEAAALPPQQAAAPPLHSAEKMAAVQPQPPSPSPSPGYVPPEPDLSVKYHVMLGLPQNLAPEAPPAGSGEKPGDPFGGPASQPADIASSLVAEFRRHLRTCAKLPPSIARSDHLKIKLRVLMTPEGRLAAEPVLIEASASAKGPSLMQSAIGALEACQPYAMLPADRYGEWKVLDLSFTPQDFSDG